MTSLIYNSAIDLVLRGAIGFQRDAFVVMLCSSGYKASKDHSGRSDVTDEVVGEGYSPLPVEVTVVKDARNDRTNVLLGEAKWPSATIKARYGVYYRKGGELIAVIDFGKDVISTNGTFSLSASTLRFQN